MSIEEVREKFSIAQLMSGDLLGNAKGSPRASEEEKIEYKYNNIYHLFKIPFRIEKYLFYCFLFHL